MVHAIITSRFVLNKNYLVKTLPPFCHTAIRQLRLKHY